jgi:hypothetical protein
LCKNHVFRTLHDGPIGSFRNSILLWCVRCTCLSLDSKFMQKVTKLFGHKFSSIVGVATLALGSQPRQWAYDRGKGLEGCGPREQPESHITCFR